MRDRGWILLRSMCGMLGGIENFRRSDRAAGSSMRRSVNMFCGLALMRWFVGCDAAIQRRSRCEAGERWLDHRMVSSSERLVATAKISACWFASIGE